MDPALVEVLKQAGLGAVAVVLGWVTKQLIEGKLVPRPFYDQEHTDRVNAEGRERTLTTLFSAALDELRKAKGAQ